MLRTTSGWWFQTFFFHFIYGIIFPIDEFIFFKMVKATNQLIVYEGFVLLPYFQWVNPLFLWSCSIAIWQSLPEGKPPFSYGFPMIFLWFSHGFHRVVGGHSAVFPPESSPRLSCDMREQNFAPLDQTHWVLLGPKPTPNRNMWIRYHSKRLYFVKTQLLVKQP